ncbi:MAG: hypothetical protein MN733_33090 [Nitrososphaera sp.]|nr:hypothetical protein [Nitrososphaera sp.]MCI0708257.1 hypothetical protein [Ignavibacteriota bacterium]
MRIWLITAVFLILFSLMGCEREFPATPGEETEGYEIAGRVTDALGNPIADVSIKVYYDFEFVDYDPPVEPYYEVENSSETIRVSVYDGDDNLIRTLYNGTHPLGEMSIAWDKRLFSGSLAPSGVYAVRVIIAGEVRKEYFVTVDETITAVTDANGEFRLVNKNLPVGFYPVPLYYPNEEYAGQHRITNFVALEFIYDNTSFRAVYVSLNRGSVSRVNIALE